MKLRNKIILKGLFHSVLQFIVIFSFAWYNNCLFEMSIIYICFFFFRTKFEKQFHAKTTWLCTIYTFIIFYIISYITPNKEKSIILVIVFTYTINNLSFYVRDYLDLVDRFKARKICISKGMNKDLLLDICHMNNLNELETNILIYYYCDRLSISSISYKLNYSYDYIVELKGKILKKIK